MTDITAPAPNAWWAKINPFQPSMGWVGFGAIDSGGEVYTRWIWDRETHIPRERAMRLAALLNESGAGPLDGPYGHSILQHGPFELLTSEEV